MKEERRLRTEDDPQGALVEALFAQAYLSHPYHWPVIGWFGDLRCDDPRRLATTLRYLLFAQQCDPRRRGRHQSRQPAPHDQTALRTDPARTGAQPIATMEPEQKGERRFLLKRDAQVPFVMMGYRVPNFTSEDSYALDILDSILSHGKSSRLYQSLVYEQKSALAVGAEYSLLQADPGLFYFYALVSPGQKPESVEDALHQEIKRLQTDPPTEQELQRAKNQVEATHVFEQDSNFRHAMLLGQAESVGAGWRKIDQFVEQIRAVTAKDIQRVARQYLTEDNRTVGTLIPLLPNNQRHLPPPRNRESHNDFNGKTPARA